MLYASPCLLGILPSSFSFNSEIVSYSDLKMFISTTLAPMFPSPLCLEINAHLQLHLPAHLSALPTPTSTHPPTVQTDTYGEESAEFMLSCRTRTFLIFAYWM